MNYRNQNIKNVVPDDDTSDDDDIFHLYQIVREPRLKRKIQYFKNLKRKANRMKSGKKVVDEISDEDCIVISDTEDTPLAQPPTAATASVKVLTTTQITTIAAKNESEALNSAVSRSRISSGLFVNSETSRETSIDSSDNVLIKNMAKVASISSLPSFRSSSTSQDQPTTSNTLLPKINIDNGNEYENENNSDNDLPNYEQRYENNIENISDHEGENILNNEEKAVSKTRWCVCPAPGMFTHRADCKICDQCFRYFHVECVGDELARRKVQAALAASRTIEDVAFVCCVCRKDSALLKKFEQAIEQFELMDDRILDSFDDSENDESGQEKQQPPQRPANLEPAFDSKKKSPETHQAKFSASKDDQAQFKKISNPNNKPKKTILLNNITFKAPAAKPSIKLVNSPNKEKGGKFCFSGASKNSPNQFKQRIKSTPASATTKPLDPDSNIISLFEKLKSRQIASKESILDDAQLQKLAERIEAAFNRIRHPATDKATSDMRKKYTGMKMAIADPKNSTFYKKLLTGEFTPEALPLMSNDQYADDRIREENLQRKEAELQAILRADAENAKENARFYRMRNQENRIDDERIQVNAESLTGRPLTNEMLTGENYQHSNLNVPEQTIGNFIYSISNFQKLDKFAIKNQKQV